jgi:sulfatase maturation enzyme AslB (radical SAM superfamily)
MNERIYTLIEEKVITYAEIIVILFEHCNLKCAFCPQAHDSYDNTSREAILSKVDYVSTWINNNNKTKYFKLHIMGGEVFEDQFISKGYLDYYKEFMNAVKDRVIDKEKDLVFNYVSNLVFTNTSPVLDFLSQEDVMLSTSYDSAGRFSPKELEIFKNNIETFKEHVGMISCVMTSQSMKNVKTDSYFKYLYDNFTIDWDSLWPSKDDKLNRFMMPKESETFEFYKFLIDNYPKCLNVGHFTSKDPVLKMSCTRGNNTTILQDNTVPKGCSGTAYVKDRKTKDDDVGEVMMNFFKTYDCFSCEYFHKCPFTCFIKQDYKYIEHDLGECVFKKTFQYVDQKIN